MRKIIASLVAFVAALTFAVGSTTTPAQAVLSNCGFTATLYNNQWRSSGRCFTQSGSPLQAVRAVAGCRHPLNGYVYYYYGSYVVENQVSAAYCPVSWAITYAGYQKINL